MILIYDPEQGCTMPTGKIVASVTSGFVAYAREGFLSLLMVAFLLLKSS